MAVPFAQAGIPTPADYLPEPPPGWAWVDLDAGRFVLLPQAANK